MAGESRDTAMYPREEPWKSLGRPKTCSRRAYSSGESVDTELEIRNDRIRESRGTPD